MAKRAGHVLTAVLLLLLALTARAQAPAAALLLDAQPDEVSLAHGELSWLRDPGGKLSLAEVQTRAASFRPVQENFTIGFTDDIYWLRLPLQAQAAPADWWLDLRPPSLDDIKLYLVRPDGSIYQRHTGALQPLSSRDANYGNFLLRLSLPQGQSTVYLRLRTSSSMSVIARLQRVGSFPVAEKCAAEYLSLPMYPELTSDQINYAAKEIKEFYA